MTITRGRNEDGTYPSMLAASEWHRKWWAMDPETCADRVARWERTGFSFWRQLAPYFDQPAMLSNTPDRALLRIYNISKRRLATIRAEYPLAQECA